MLMPDLGMIKNCLKLEILKSLWDNSYSVLEVSLELLLPLLSFVVCVLGGKERRSLKLPGGYLIMFRDSPRRLGSQLGGRVELIVKLGMK
jgi:hypothetical protein